MRTAVFGDIHANLEALLAVLADAQKQHCSDFVCTGDIVGYNANPSECLRIVRDLDCPVVMGNHDEEAALDTPLTGYNPTAARAMGWTRAQLSSADKLWLSKLPLTLTISNATYAHATLENPARWGYVVNDHDVTASLTNQHTPLCFIGHTHTPKIYGQKNRQVRVIPGPILKIDPSVKYVINVGSVGQPRDGNWRASYAIWDTKPETVEIRRVGYDVGEARKKVSDLPFA